MEDFLKLVKEFASLRLKDSGLVNGRPAFLFSVHLVADSGGIATAAIYNSQTASGDPLVDLSAPSGSTDQRVFVPPLFFDKGIYADLGDHATSILLQFRQTGDLQRATKIRSLKSYLPSWLGGPSRE
jgi:hypothetical protein